MYKLISPSSMLADNILERVCINRGLDVEKIKNPSKEDIVPYNCLVNINRAVEALISFYNFAKSGGTVRVGIIADSDT